MSDLTAAGFAWVFLSVVSTICIAIGFYLPYWLVGAISLNGKRNIVYFGAFRRCNYPVFDQILKHFRIENRCGRYATFADIPSIYWQIATVSIGFGCALSLVLSLLLIPSCCFKHILSRNSAILVGLLQVVAAIAVSSGCVIYPLGWDNREVRDACGSRSNPYVLGECQLGWAYACMLSGAALTLLCGVLSICSIKESNYYTRHDHIENHYDRDDYNTRCSNHFRSNSFIDSRTLIEHRNGRNSDSGSQKWQITLNSRHKAEPV
ncbi:lipoma HMGIC fusion partner-like protein [Ditylenchus destructor]|nr:lipoma HMGIC fusion partner-like protein [Ditylenchus destructor]